MIITKHRSLLRQYYSPVIQGYIMKSIKGSGQRIFKHVPLHDCKKSPDSKRLRQLRVKLALTLRDCNGCTRLHHWLQFNPALKVQLTCRHGKRSFYDRLSIRQFIIISLSSSFNFLDELSIFIHYLKLLKSLFMFENVIQFFQTISNRLFC